MADNCEAAILTMQMSLLAKGKCIRQLSDWQSWMILTSLPVIHHSNRLAGLHIYLQTPDVSPGLHQQESAPQSAETPPRICRVPSQVRLGCRCFLRMSPPSETRGTEERRTDVLCLAEWKANIALRSWLTPPSHLSSPGAGAVEISVSDSKEFGNPSVNNKMWNLIFTNTDF